MIEKLGRRSIIFASVWIIAYAIPLRCLGSTFAPESSRSPTLWVNQCTTQTVHVTNYMLVACKTSGDRTHHRCSRMLDIPSLSPARGHNT